MSTQPAMPRDSLDALVRAAELPSAPDRELERGAGVGGVFGVIYSDPPWRHDVSVPSRAIENHYPTMSGEDICALNVPSAKDCVLFLWATAPKLRAAFAVIEAWGFDYRTHAIWDKQRIGCGWWVRNQHELLMIARKGDMKTPAQSDRISSVMKFARGPHSAKPDRVRDLIAKWYPTERRLEMFARLAHPGWETFGNQVERDMFSGPLGGGGRGGSVAINGTTDSGSNAESSNCAR